MIVDTTIAGIVGAIDVQNSQTAHIQIKPIDGDADSAVIEVKRAFDASLRTPSTSFSVPKILTLDGSIILRIDVTDTAFLHFEVTTAQADRKVDIEVVLSEPMSGFVVHMNADASILGTRADLAVYGRYHASIVAVPYEAVTTASASIKCALERTFMPVSLDSSTALTLDGSTILDVRLQPAAVLFVDVDAVQAGQTLDMYVYVRDEVNSDTYNRGFADYNDTATASTPISLAADTWTPITNNGLGVFTDISHLPRGVSQLMDVSTGEIDPRELRIGDDLFVRNDFSVDPQSNGAEIRFRYKLGTGAGTYYLEETVGTISNAGDPHKMEFVDYIYIGNAMTRDNTIQMQIKSSKIADVVINGSVIRVTRSKT